jgi:hypothetical protein
MIDDKRVAQWSEDAATALMRSYGTDETIGHFASIVLALIRDREERENYLERSRNQ